MTEKEPRIHTAVRLSPAGHARVAELAKVETEGNVSLMIRKLLSEAITARDRRAER